MTLKRPHRGPWARLCLLAGALLFAAPVMACPIPVYQYALEWWARDAYEIYVFDTGERNEAQDSAIAQLKGISEGQGTPANIRLRMVQSDSKERLRAHSALRGEVPASYPWMAVYYPSTSRNARRPVWMGEVNSANVEALLDSPVRQRISEELIERTSVVWLLLESGNARADREAHQLLEQEVERLAKTLTPPDPAAFGMDIPITPIKFETMRLSRDDEAEQMLIRMLMNTEVDLEEFAGEPMVFPIFGRGLIMNALIGRGINAHMILDTAEFLTGACSCTVKSLNPGVDLITAVDWAARVKPMSQEFTTETGGLGGFLDSTEKVKGF